MFVNEKKQHFLVILCISSPPHSRHHPLQVQNIWFNEFVIWMKRVSVSMNAWIEYYLLLIDVPEFLIQVLWECASEFLQTPSRRLSDPNQVSLCPQTAGSDRESRWSPRKSVDALGSRDGRIWCMWWNRDLAALVARSSNNEVDRVLEWMTKSYAATFQFPSLRRW